MLTINHVTKKQENVMVLEDINLEFSQGIYGILGPNGAGKSTLIKMLGTLLFPDQGEILWKGTEIHALDEGYRTMIGYLPQEFGYYKNYSPKQFLRYLGALKGMKPEGLDEKINEVLELVALKAFENKKMKGFSGGMIQWVGIAQAILNDPQILILDEPTAGLDPKERVRFRNIISKLGRDRIVILSTHIVEDIENIGGKVIMIKDHKIFCCDHPKDICKKLQGSVYVIEDRNLIKGDHFILSENWEEERNSRFVSKEDQGFEAKPVSPNLEDIFLYVYQEENKGS